MNGKLYLIGIGPGSKAHLTKRAEEAMAESRVIVGYKTYVDLVADLVENKEVVSSGMMKEVERARNAVDLAMEGKTVGVISSGDPGVYAMASMVLEYLKEKDIHLEVEVVPGITSANASAALLGSPLGHDFAVISLSDLLTPWEVIEKRLEAASAGDFAIVLYNPKSKKRDWQLDKAVEIIMTHRSPDTPAGVVRNAMREDQSVVVTTLEKLPRAEVDMLSTVIIGNTETFVFDHRMITPRGYKRKYDL